MMLMHDNVWTADLGDGTFQNPILYADYSDLDVIRVGSDFFMVASSFAHTPGLPILHSKDLVNWTIVNHVITHVDLPGYGIPQHGKGIWAPSIRFHDNKFWIFVSTPDEGIFMSTADDPFGNWTPLHMIKEVKGWIDPCPFWNEDGTAYLVHAFAHSRAGIKSKLNLCRMSPDGKQLLDEGVIVFDGTEHHPTMEGPKMYKRNGFYYIFAPAGGVATGWQTILRSRNVEGPYEDKIVLHQGGTAVNGPHQGAWVELESGESWFLHFQDRNAYGRIVHLQPMEWVSDWPIMGMDSNGDGIGEPVLHYKKPDVGAEYPVEVPQTSDDFNGQELGRQWQWQANPRPDWYSLTDSPGSLRLFCKPLKPQLTQGYSSTQGYPSAQGAASLYEAPQLLLQKFPAPEFTATAKLHYQPSHEADLAGLMIFGFSYRYLALRRSGEGSSELVLMQGETKAGVTNESEETVVEYTHEATYVRVAVANNAICRFSYSVDGELFTAIGQPFQATVGRWVGAKVGIFAVNSAVNKEIDENLQSAGYADFEWFSITK
ncbi:glycoside hydrolase family 43 protein [Paenibacillus agricola]|uniref:Glycosyl hydrolase 43 family protein n=1 Tax=Paenibacillus agricola TaxID=2716264 RepID=A0ABX0J0Z0_9BACL|nr:glycoside hydrolase 43 family protein [Paenibacillus agricola]NHN29496.1 glycosyl hydrolase 43 family protein [Paenibacillus agricola]